MTQDDLIMAFFPCIRFENQINISLRGQAHGMENWTDKQKVENCMRIQNEVNEFYQLVSKLFLLCEEKGLRMILENPYSKEHYLQRYWCIQPSIIDMDRTERGDYFVKPTQFWFFNCAPEQNVIFEVISINALGVGEDRLSKAHCNKIGKDVSIKTARSMIHPHYANRFIREFIL